MPPRGADLYSDRVTRVAILDDYQDVARRLADWKSLPAEVVVFRDHLSDESQVAARLADFDVVVAMRERTPFPRSLFERSISAPRPIAASWSRARPASPPPPPS